MNVYIVQTTDTRTGRSWVEKVFAYESDAEYDALENEYRKLCEEEGVEPTAADMVDFDLSRSCCRIVALKLSSPKGTSFDSAKRKVKK